MPSDQSIFDRTYSEASATSSTSSSRLDANLPKEISVDPERPTSSSRTDADLPNDLKFDPEHRYTRGKPFRVVIRARVLHDQGD
jgi:hypothetical protein